MGQKESLNASLHRCVYNCDVDGLAECFRVHESEFTSTSVDENIYVELIQRQWDSNTIYRFAKLANDHQLAVLIATAVLHSHTVPLAPLFDLMRDCERAIEEHQLKHLFLIACERENVDAVRTFITNKCYNPSDTRPIRSVVRAQLNKSVVHEEFLKLVLEAHPMQTDNVQYVRNEYFKDAKSDSAREIIDIHLLKYISCQ